MRKRKNLRLIFIIGSFIMAASVTASDHPYPKFADDPAIEEFIYLINGKRQRMGCVELKWDERLAAVARNHSRDMARRNFFSHTNLDGDNPFDRLRDSHISYSLAGENIASGVRSGQAVYELWLNSPDHAENMLDCRFTHQGVGRSGKRWTQVLLRPPKNQHH